MRGPTFLRSYLRNTFLSAAGVVALWGCAAGEGSDDNTGGSTTTTTGPGGTGAQGGGFATGSTTSTGGACVSTNEKAEPTPLDIIFVLDWSGSMQGVSWAGSTTALKNFMQDPESAGINAGMVFFPTIKEDFDDTCDPLIYSVLDVPIAPLPGNAFALTNSMPADAIGSPTPLSAGLRGALQTAVARQELLPTHKVIVVLATDGGYNTCSGGLAEIVSWPEAARNYNGVETYVIAVQSSADINFNALNAIAAAGGTTLYDASDIDLFAEKIAEIRDTALGCDYALPPPPANIMLVPDEVNFTYTPGGSGTPITLPRADDLADCGTGPGWYYDNNQNPTKIIVCPASCITIQNDMEAEIEVAFGCASVPN
ncbi:MAG: VWA domain-containing protein [Myxococcales bacterium]|nr:VWA domain-containing protein [Myxococcales bacterium]